MMLEPKLGQRQMAWELGMAPSTFCCHRARLFRKAKVSDRYGLLIALLGPRSSQGSRVKGQSRSPGVQESRSPEALSTPQLSTSQLLRRARMKHGV